METLPLYIAGILIGGDMMLPFLKIAGIAIPMYGMCITFGIACALLCWSIYCKGNICVWADGVIIAFSGIGIGFIGAKLLYIIITFSPKEIFSLISEHGLKLVSDSGFVFYGGLIFGIMGAVLVAHFAKINVSEYESAIVPYIPLVHVFGRIGCLFAGCCYGQATTSLIHIVYTMPLSDAPINIPLVPVQAYEALFNLMLFMFLMVMRKQRQDLVLPAYICVYAIGRFMMEFLRDDKIRGGWLGLSTSQLISIVVFIAGVLIVILRRKKIFQIKNKVSN